MKSRLSPEDRFVVIMAGGRGERFWPLSREKTPKQLLTLLGDRSLLQQAVDRVLPLVPVTNIFVVTTESQAAEVQRQLPRIPRRNIVAEPCGRDTCAAVALGAALVGQRSLTGVMAVLPADHVIPEERKFQKVLEEAFDVASRGQVMVTIGIQPHEPATGYGYIRVGEPLPPPKGVKNYRTAFYRAQAFVEKPMLEKAVEYVSSGQYRWNAGMFVWSFVTITEGLTQHYPEMAEACHRWFESTSPLRLRKALAKDYPNLKRQSVDYALMEKAQNVVLADGGFAWDDLGSWPALMRHLKSDASGNCAVGDLVEVDAARNLVYDARTAPRTPVALVGLRDTVVVLADDAVLIMPRDQSQRLKELVRKLSDSPSHRRSI